MVAENWLTANGVVGFWPANADGDDIVVYADETRTAERARLYTLRQQIARSSDSKRAPRRARRFRRADGDRASPTIVGGFAVTAGIGEEAVAERFARANDDYSKILSQALADRLAEAFAERMHERVRREFWGYAPDEALSPRRADPRALSTASGRRRAIRPSPTTPRRRRCSTCSTRKPRPASG